MDKLQFLVLITCNVDGVKRRLFSYARGRHCSQQYRAHPPPATATESLMDSGGHGCNCFKLVTIFAGAVPAVGQAYGPNAVN